MSLFRRLFERKPAKTDGKKPSLDDRVRELV